MSAMSEPHMPAADMYCRKCGEMWGCDVEDCEQPECSCDCMACPCPSHEGKKVIHARP